MKNTAINILEIARIANVHPSTVSRALNGSTLIKEETRLRIQEIAEQHNYVPNSFAQSMQHGKSFVWGVIVPEISNSFSFYSIVIDTIEQVLSQYGYSFVIGTSHSDATTELQAIRTMLSRQVDALVICAPTAHTDEYVQSVSQMIPIIMCDTKHPTIYDSVYVDDKIGIIEALKHLKEKGHTRIGCIADHISTSRTDTFIECLKECNLPIYEELIYYTNEIGNQGGYEGLHALYQRGTIPTALFTTRDNIALGAIRAATELHLDIPSQISIIGYDDAGFSRYLPQNLTTIHQPVKEIGENVADILVRRLEGKETSQTPTQVRLLSELIIRETT